MAMKNSTICKDFGLVNGRVDSYTDDVFYGSMMNGTNEKESEKSEHDILEDFDSYWEDINDRLIISRMVNDSVIKGMVNAVEQEAAEKIAQKEFELARFKETLNLYHVGADECESFGSLVMQQEPGSAKHGPYSTLSDAVFHYDRIGESVGSLKNVAKEQLKNLRKEIERIRGSSSIRRMGSGSEMVGLGGILQDKVSDIKWMDVDKTLDSLRTTMDNICKQVDDMVHLSKALLYQWHEEREFKGEIEDMVIMDCIRNLKEEFEERLWDQNARFYDKESVSWLEKMKEISSLRQELDTISKSLSVPEIGHITPHGSTEIVEESNNNKTDHLHHKVSGNHVSFTTSLWEGNGKHDESVIAVPENLDLAQLKHMTKEELVTYFKTEMTKMKRNHEHRVQEMTEEYFILRRESFREGVSSLLKKDKEFDALRKKIPEVILKLDDILVENEKLPTFSKDAQNLCSLKDRLETLVSENRQLRSMLTDKKREVKHLASQVSNTAEIRAEHCLLEANLLKRIENLQCSVEDAHIETSIREDVYKCLLRDMLESSGSVSEQSVMEYKIMQEIFETIFRGAAQNAGASSKYELEDSDMESVIMQGLCSLIFRESLREAEEKLNDFSLKYINENELRVLVEKEALQKEEALILEFVEKERLKEETLSLSLLVEEKEKLAEEAEAALVKEKEQFEFISQKLDKLRDEKGRLEILISESSKESDLLKGNLMKTLEQIELYKVEVHELKQKLELTMKELTKTNEEKRMLLSIIKEKQNSVLMIEAKDKEHKKQMQSLIILVQGLLKAISEFEFRVMEDIKRSNKRLDNLSSQLSALIQKSKITKRTELMYKQRLERRCSDLQKAEAEVDLLGDEVDTLLGLLEKIYIALDHYSPVLRHYPGIIEILKLVRRELSGEPTKPA